MASFKLQGHEFIELNNLLKVTGLCESGGLAKKRIAEGLVTVDGKIELRKRCKIRAGQCVSFNNEQVDVS